MTGGRRAGVADHLDPVQASVGRVGLGLRPARPGCGHGRDEVFRQLVLARLVEPTSKLDSMFAYMRPESPLSRAAAVIRPSCGKNWQLRSVKIGTSRRIAQAALADFIAAPTEEPR